jgi:hypothetical protein
LKGLKYFTEKTVEEVGYYFTIRTLLNKKWLIAIGGVIEVPVQ